MKIMIMISGRALSGCIGACLLLGAGGQCGAALVYPQEQAGAKQVLYENASQVLREKARFFPGLRLEGLTQARPHLSYTVQLEDVGAGKLLSAVEWERWRYLVAHGTNALAEAELLRDSEGVQFVFLLPGDRTSDAFLQALRQAEQLPQVKQRDCEPRYIVCPLTPFFFAVWLHGKTDDIIIPLPPTYGWFNAFQPYSESQVIKVLRPKAQADLKMASPPARRTDNALK